MTATDRTRDEAERAQSLLNDQIACIDAALAFMEQRKAVYQPGIYANLWAALNSHRDKALWYLDQPNHGGRTALGLMGINGRGPLLDQTIRSVDFHANRVRYVPPAFQKGIAA
ncbi:hypothetical protein [Sphingobium fuliginis]|uniref:Uncharacterized protein n=1 Tax=Sphingobium fuliginis ATCC 27551 TaxID=1208342 RepID=A0A5B8CCT9_SPHSA|nr:hypothetical protein [Sphingobium fuliginis]QDC37069.1 hypothetical protein FIL70_07385 [Sphingobium fuliginis ATCC 27551]